MYNQADSGNTHNCLACTEIARIIMSTAHTLIRFKVVAHFASDMVVAHSVSVIVVAHSVPASCSLHPQEAWGYPVSGDTGSSLVDEYIIIIIYKYVYIPHHSIWFASIRWGRKDYIDTVVAGVCLWCMPTVLSKALDAPKKTKKKQPLVWISYD